MNKNKRNAKKNDTDPRTQRSWMRYVCHQQPERCFMVNGKPMAICARCFGVYLGLFIGLIIPFIFTEIYSVNVTILLLLMLFGVSPMAIDGFTQLMGLRSSNNNLRFISGFIAGLFLGVLFNWLIMHVFVLD